MTIIIIHFINNFNYNLLIILNLKQAYYKNLNIFKKNVDLVYNMIAVPNQSMAKLQIFNLQNLFLKADIFKKQYYFKR